VVKFIKIRSHRRKFSNSDSVEQKNKFSSDCGIRKRSTRLRDKIIALLLRMSERNFSREVEYHKILVKKLKSHKGIRCPQCYLI
ncbi:unnamed protein product, partial [Tenebrio molitor]